MIRREYMKRAEPCTRCGLASQVLHRVCFEGLSAQYSASFSCDACGHAWEVDSDIVPPPIEAGLLERDGKWCLLLQGSHGDLAHDVSALMRILALERSAALSVAKNMPSEVPICAGIKARVEGVSDALAVYGLGSIVARDPEC
jgi:hypothetical protein